jgi:hypothetical protein
LTLSHNYRYAEVLHLTEKRLENLIFILKWDLETLQVTEEYFVITDRLNIYRSAENHLQ